MHMSKFADVLKQVMKEKRISISETSRKTGIPQSTLSEWSNGRTPKLDYSVIKLAQFLGVSVEYLVTGKDIEEEIFTDIVNSGVEQFTQIHKGTYRITIEKKK